MIVKLNVAGNVNSAFNNFLNEEVILNRECSKHNASLEKRVVVARKYVIIHVKRYTLPHFLIRVYSWKCGADGCYRQMWQVSCRRQGMLTQGPAPDPKSKV